MTTAARAAAPVPQNGRRLVLELVGVTTGVGELAWAGVGVWVRVTERVAERDGWTVGVAGSVTCTIDVHNARVGITVEVPSAPEGLVGTRVTARPKEVRQAASRPAVSNP